MDWTCRVDQRRRAVLLDRDGVINEAELRNGRPYPPHTLDDMKIAAGAHAALNRLREAGYLLVVVTNQPDVTRGTQRREVIEALNASLMSQLPLRDILVCYHDDGDACECRKPNPGLLFQAAELFSLDLARSFLVGDRWKDIEAGRRAGCKTILIGDAYGEPSMTRATYRADSLADAASWILNEQREIV